jgi:hypothetical protein
LEQFSEVVNSALKRLAQKNGTNLRYHSAGANTAFVMKDGLYIIVDPFKVVN